MKRPQKRWLIGKTIEDIHWKEFDAGRGGPPVTEPTICFTDGSRLALYAEETEEEPGVRALYFPAMTINKGEE